MKKCLFFISLGVLAACSSGQRETLAHITQRRIDSTGKVMISYQFRTDKGLVSDSMEVQRTIIVPHDSVKVVYQAGNPSESHLQLP
jgi:cytochrome c oxidase assembly protein Cox11